jgi:hypothetical protein
MDQFAERTPEVGYDLRTAIGRDSVRNTMQLPYAIAEDLCHSKRVSLALLVHYGKQVSHFRETIYDNENSVESCRPR